MVLVEDVDRNRDRIGGPWSVIRSAPRSRIQRADIGQMDEIRDDGGLSRGEGAQPRARRLARGGPAEIETYVARGNVIRDLGVGVQIPHEGHAGADLGGD